MRLEGIITLLLGGILYVLVRLARQRNSNPTKSFKVTDGKRKKTVLLPYTSFESFSEKCRNEFGLGEQAKVCFASAGEDDIELEKDCLVDLKDNSLLIVKGAMTGYNDDHDDNGENDNSFGSEILGSGSFTCNTVVDNEDIQKWEDIHAGSEVKEHIIKYGLKGITSVLKKNVDGWKNKPLHIAVTGESGKGKSSFINAFRGMSPNQEGAARVDEDECTTDCRAFRHPKSDSFVLWDVPGVGTSNFPKENYLKAINFDKYEFFMIITSTRFSELDIWLAKEISMNMKKLYFIRSKIDNDMSEKEKRFRKLGQPFHEMEEFYKMRSATYKKINESCDFQVGKMQFFMISNHYPNKYDFPLILGQLLLDVPDGKKDAMLFVLEGMSKDILIEKASALKSRIWKVALMSGVGASIPIPFVSAGIETALVLKELLFYEEQFGLDDQSLTHLANMAGKSIDDLKMSIEFRTPTDIFTPDGFNSYFLKYDVWETAETTVKYAIPVVGSVISCGMSFSTAMTFLEGIIEMMKEDALNVLVYVSSETEIK